MRFTLLDRITRLEPGSQIEAVKALSLAEEYLQDHFPRFPVMPGVLMVEAMFQASLWLIHKTENFAHSALLLKEARNVKFADFVEPGQILRVQATILKQDEQTTTLKTQGLVDNKTAVTARLVVERTDLGQLCPTREAYEPVTRSEMRKHFELLYQPEIALQPPPTAPEGPG